VVIMLVVRGERVAIAHNVNFPDTLYSLIAGFVEPGETIEEAVRRETLEELGLRCGRVDYLCSQPWPFPAALMFGCIAEALDDDFTLEEAELSDAVWLDRDELAAVFRGENETISPPRKGAIASSLLRDWMERKVG
jgi:NAD+ diphosphatase